MDLRIDAGSDVGNGAFSPCETRIAFSNTDYGLSMGVIAVDHSIASSPFELVTAIGDSVFDRIGSTYAGVFDFPSAYGPDYYLGAVGAVPENAPISENLKYVTRMTRWRDNVWHKELRPNSGYMREVYSVSFVLQDHLDKLIGGHSFSEYMESVGTLKPVEGRNGLYRWDVSKESIAIVREELEESGMILSASLV